MGYKRKPKTFRLIWPEEHDNHGLEVRVRSLSIDELTHIGGMAELDLSRDSGPEAMAALDDMLALFADKLVDWNLEYDDEHELAGQPVPADLTGVKAQDVDFMLEMVDAWMTAAAGVAPPLSGSSNGGETSLAASIPMEPLSTSRAS